MLGMNAASARHGGNAGTHNKCRFAFSQAHGLIRSSWSPLATARYTLGPLAMMTSLRTKTLRAKHSIWHDTAQMRIGLYADCGRLASGRDTSSGLSRRCEPVWPHSTESSHPYMCNCAAKRAESRCEAIEKRVLFARLLAIMSDIQLLIVRLRIYQNYLRQYSTCNPHVAAYVAGRIHDLETVSQTSCQSTSARRRSSTSSGEQACSR